MNPTQKALEQIWLNAINSGSFKTSLLRTINYKKGDLYNSEKRQFIKANSIVSDLAQNRSFKKPSNIFHYTPTSSSF